MKRVLIWLGVVVVLVVSVFVAWSNKYELHDWWVLRNFEPTADVSAISKTLELTDEGQRIFYVHDPRILDAEGFNTNCPIRENSIVLGCYDGAGIFIYDVPEIRLNGIEEVTSAHEMLHAAYERLSESEKTEVNYWLNVAYETSASQRVREVLSTYDQNNKTLLLNELHSIVATEMEEIPEYLEGYYSRYFKDRSKIVEISKQYEAVFTELQDQVKVLDAQLEQLSAKVNLQEAEVESLYDQVVSSENNLKSLLAREEFEKYNASLPAHNSLINTYNSKIAILEGYIETYNNLVSRRNDLSVEQNNLVKSIDSRFEEVDK